MFSHCETCESDVSVLEFEEVTNNSTRAIRDVRILPTTYEPRKRLHSPGPWDARINDPRKETVPYEITIVSLGTNFRNDVATFVPVGDGEHDRTTLAANVALTIAAPDLLRELESILYRLDMEPAGSDFPCSAMREGIRKTIAKAKTITPRILAECCRLANDIESSDDASCDFD
jgi:hypothetical protein